LLHDVPPDQIINNLLLIVSFKKKKKFISKIERKKEIKRE